MAEGLSLARALPLHLKHALSRLLPDVTGKPIRRAARDALKLPRADFVLISFPKSGRTWVRVMMSRLYHTHLSVPGEEIIEFDNLHRLDPRIPNILFTHDGEPWYRPEELPADKSKYADKKVILLARHPIDVAVSRYFHIRNRATLLPHKEYAEMPINEFMWAPLGGLQTIVAYMNIWDRARQTMPHVLVVRYEDFRAEPVPTLARLAEFLGIGATLEEVKEAVDYAAFENLRKKEEQGAISSHRLGARQPGNPDSLKVRRGKVGGYRDYFNEEEIARLEQYVRDNLSPSYGYGRPTA